MNRIFHYKNTENDINIKDTNILELVCIFVNVQDHRCIITEDLLYIINAKLLRTIKGWNYREHRTINWNRCKDKIIDGLVGLIKKTMSTKRNITQQFLSS